LNLAECKIGDDGLKALAGLTALQNLNLAETQVTDAGLDQLKGLKNLKTLDLSADSDVTPSGVAKLQKALPHCQIKSDS
jgi:hypothetical protein